LASEEDFSLEDGAQILGWASYACLELHVQMHNGRVVALIEGRPEVDMTNGPRGTLNANGYPVSRKYFWSKWKELMPEALSEENLGKIARGDSPVVDETWIKAFPDDAEFIGETIEHHHDQRGHLAIPLPGTKHRGKGYNQQNHH
jgi:hypothetical protein